MYLQLSTMSRTRQVRGRRFLILMPLAALALAGCAQRWAKPGASDGDFRVARMRCETIGYQRLPPDLHWTQLTAGHVTPGQRHCWKSHGQRRCSYSPGHYVPPRFGHVDRNDPLRERLLSGCLLDDGWRPVD
jgi:hypothetical protein